MISFFRDGFLPPFKARTRFAHGAQIQNVSSTNHTNKCKKNGSFLFVFIRVIRVIRGLSSSSLPRRLRGGRLFALQRADLVAVFRGFLVALVGGRLQHLGVQLLDHLFLVHLVGALTGCLADQLSKTGEQQSALLGEYWRERGIAFDEVYSGSFQRQLT